VVFSGDLGCDDAVLLKAPKSPPKADVLVIEATYGHRNHEGRADRRRRLEQCIDHALQDLGTVLIPAFSLGRTQELLYEIELILSERMKREHGRGMWSELVVVVDSPLASKFTQIYRRLKPYWDREAQKRLKLGHSPLNFAQLITVDDHDSHHRVVQHLKRTARPAIVISASGMCQGGRIMDYLKNLLPDKRTDMIFVGYQASDSLGRAIQDGAERVYIDGEPVDVLASVYTISGYSAHADQQGLLDFVKGMAEPPREIRIVHGEEFAKKGLQKALSEDLPETFVWVPDE
jgi:metallo-beta-lactamase family protein